MNAIDVIESTVLKKFHIWSANSSSKRWWKYPSIILDVEEKHSEDSGTLVVVIENEIYHPLLNAQIFNFTFCVFW